MKFSTGRKRGLKLQGHRRRRKGLEPTVEKESSGLSWTEYKTIRQYQTMGDILDLLMILGSQAGDEVNFEIFDDNKRTTSNGYFWLTKDAP